METREVRRYELIFKNKKTLDTVSIEIEGKTKHYLSEIDLFTMKYIDKFDFYESIKHQNILLSYIKDISEYDLLIRYRVNEEYKYIPRASDKLEGIIYLDKAKIKPITEKANTKISDKDTKKMLGRYAISIINKDLYEYLLKNNLLSERLKEFTKNFLDSNGKFSLEGIEQELSRYKVTRGVVIGLIEYEKITKKVYFPETIMPKEEPKKIEVVTFKPTIPQKVLEERYEDQLNEERHFYEWDEDYRK